MTDREGGSDRAVGATSLFRSDRPSRAFARGRICADESCSTRLSIYNEGSYCYQHQPTAVPRMRGKKIA